MEDYWISFRVHDNSTRKARYDNFVQDVETYCTGWWDETTSFYIASYDVEIDDLCLLITQSLDSNVDTVVVKYLSKKGSRYFGKIKNLSLLKNYLPHIKLI